MTNFDKEDNQSIFEILKILWEGKFIIFAFSFISILSGIIFITFKKDNYIVAISYTSNVAPLSSQLAGESIKNVEEQYGRRLLNSLDDNWYKDKYISKLQLSTTEPNKKKFIKELNLQNEILTNEIYSEAVQELRLTKNLVAQNSLFGDSAFKYIVTASRIVATIDGGKKVLSFNDLKIKMEEKKLSLIIFLSLIIGLTFGMTLTLIRNGLVKSK